MNLYSQRTSILRAMLNVAVRRGTTLVELLVAFSLVMATLSISVPLVVCHGRLLTDADHYRIALDELTNQLDRLRALPVSRISEELQQLKPSTLTAQRLEGATLEGDMHEGDMHEGESGRRVKLKLFWDEPQRRQFPVELVAWLPPEGAAGSEPAAARSAP